LLCCEGGRVRVQRAGEHPGLFPEPARPEVRVRRLSRRSATSDSVRGVRPPSLRHVSQPDSPVFINRYTLRMRYTIIFSYAF